jgi:hypothetical protein
MKVINLIKSLAKNAGIENQKELSEFLEANKESLDGLDLPDIAGNLLQENLMSEEVAKTKLSLKTHFAGLLFAGIEQGARERAKEAGISDEEISAIEDQQAAQEQQYQENMSKTGLNPGLKYGR